MLLEKTKDDKEVTFHFTFTLLSQWLMHSEV